MIKYPVFTANTIGRAALISDVQANSVNGTDNVHPQYLGGELMPWYASQIKHRHTGTSSGYVVLTADELFKLEFTANSSPYIVYEHNIDAGNINRDECLLSVYLTGNRYSSSTVYKIKILNGVSEIYNSENISINTFIEDVQDLSVSLVNGKATITIVFEIVSEVSGDIVASAYDFKIKYL